MDFTLELNSNRTDVDERNLKFPPPGKQSFGIWQLLLYGVLLFACERKWWNESWVSPGTKSLTLRISERCFSRIWKTGMRNMIPISIVSRSNQRACPRWGKLQTWVWLPDTRKVRLFMRQQYLESSNKVLHQSRISDIMLTLIPLLDG